MAYSYTMAQLVTQVRYRADITGFTIRHTDAELQQYVQDSFARLVELVSSCGSREFVRTSECSAAESSSDGVVYLCELDQLSSVQWNDGTRWNELPKLSDTEALEYARQGTPEGWTMQSVTSTGSFPSFVRWGVKLWPYVGTDYTLVTVSDVRCTGMYSVGSSPATYIPLHVHAYDWLILDAASRVMLRNADSMGTYQMLLLERERAEKQIRRSIMSETTTPTQRDYVQRRHR